MNSITIVGQLRGEPKVHENSLTVMVQYTKRGRGKFADRSFTRIVKAVTFGQDVQALAMQLRPGDILMCAGEAEAEAYMKEGQPRAVVKVIGTISKVFLDPELAPPENPPSPPLPDEA